MSSALLHPLPAAAARLGISRRTLEREIADGQIAVVSIRGAVRVAEADIIGYIARHRRYTGGEQIACRENVATLGTRDYKSTGGALKSLLARERVGATRSR